MVRFEFRYDDEKCVVCPHIIKATYNGSAARVEVKENDLLSHLFPVEKAIWLQSEDANYSISGRNLRFIDISKEE